MLKPFCLSFMIVPVIAVEFGVSTFVNKSVYDGEFDVDVERTGILVDIPITDISPTVFGVGIGTCNINDISGIEVRAVIRVYGNIGCDYIKPFAGIGGGIIWNEQKLYTEGNPQTVHVFEQINNHTVLVDSYDTIDRIEMSRVNYSGFAHVGILIGNDDLFTRIGVEYSHISNGGREPINISMDTIGWFCEVGWRF